MTSQSSAGFTSYYFSTQQLKCSCLLKAQAQDCPRTCWQEAGQDQAGGKRPWMASGKGASCAMQSTYTYATQGTNFKGWQDCLSVLTCCPKRSVLGLRKKLTPWLPAQCGSFRLQVLVKQNPMNQDSGKLGMSRLCFNAEQRCRVKWRLQLAFHRSSKTLCSTEPARCRSLEVARQVKRLIAEINLTACWVHTEP